MRKEDCFYLGKIVKKYSFNGDVLVKLDTDEPEMYEEMESVLVDKRNKLIPFFIEESQLHKSELLRVRFEDVDTEEDADVLIGSNLYLRLDLLPELTGNQIYFNEIIGSSAIDESFGEIGKRTGVNDSTPEALFEIDREGTEVLIPMAHDCIQKVDREQKTIFLNIPEGLIDILLQDRL